MAVLIGSLNDVLIISIVGLMIKRESLGPILFKTFGVLFSHKGAL